MTAPRLAFPSSLTVRELSNVNNVSMLGHIMNNDVSGKPTDMLINTVWRRPAIATNTTRFV